MPHADVVIAGNGIVGLALALELRNRGCAVTLLTATRQGTASTAAAGMLAAHDPHNPPALRSLANLALRVYPSFLRNVEQLSGKATRIHTSNVMEPDSEGVPGDSLLPSLAASAGNFRLRPEQSLDPRELLANLRLAVDTLQIPQIPADSAVAAELDGGSVLIDCSGAWGSRHTRPAKGQMLRVLLPPEAMMLADGSRAVLRTADIYIVPRLDNSALIGATVEDAGFDLTTHSSHLDELRTTAAALLPLAARAPELERWSGLRPRTPDDLPVLGWISPNRLIANGLFRNGILLAPAVAHVMAQVLTGEPCEVDLAPFAPDRPTLGR